MVTVVTLRHGGSGDTYVRWQWWHICTVAVVTLRHGGSGDTYVRWRWWHLGTLTLRLGNMYCSWRLLPLILPVTFFTLTLTHGDCWSGMTCIAVDTYSHRNFCWQLLQMTHIPVGNYLKHSTHQHLFHLTWLTSSPVDIYFCWHFN